MSHPTRYYTVRRQSDGTQRTVAASSLQAAKTKFLTTYRGLQPGEIISFKEFAKGPGGRFQSISGAEWIDFKYQG